MAESNGNGKHWTENFRVLTPILVTIAIFFLGNLNAMTKNIDDKLFKHLTNDEIHCPKSMVVTKAEFDIYQSMRDRQMSDLKEGVYDIKRILEKHAK